MRLSRRIRAIALAPVALLLFAAPLGAAADPPFDCSHARAVPERLWPPDHRLVSVTVTGVTGRDGQPASILVTGVTQDEPVDGGECPDAVLGNVAMRLRAERSATGNGRVYVVSFVANDGAGNLCNGTVTVCVPHDAGRGACVDDGGRYDSLGPCPPAPKK
jgi:hypothetical protein